jgi:dihydropteroate synthase
MMFLYSCSVCVIRGRIWCKFRQIFIRDYVILRKFYTEIMTLNCRGTLVDLTIPKIMGILNLTPDSFYDGGRFDSWDAALKQTQKMLEEGATIIDVGAVSSRPGATALNTEEESKRLFPLLSELLRVFPETLFSVDTFDSQIAHKALDQGVALINDISGGASDAAILEIVAQYDAPYVCMHMQGSPQNMQDQPEYQSVVEEQLLYFSQKKEQLYKAGIQDVIIDPGFGFGKNKDHNYQILKNLKHYHRLKSPLMVGISRKSMIYKTLNIPPEEALNGTTSLHTVALQHGAHILRVHDVKEAVQVVELLQALN